MKWSRLAELTQDLTIEIIGAMPARVLQATRDRLATRKAAGEEVEFEEVDLKRRVDPEEAYGLVGTILVIGLPLVNPSRKKSNDPMRGTVSMFALGEDYHLAMQREIELLMERLANRGIEGQVQVDTGPLLERAFAQAAGVGFQGKNATVIHSDWGSLFFLGLILVKEDLGLEREAKEDGCGTCTRCQKACPTGALDRSYRMEVKRCLSYWTQAKASVPFWIRERWGNRIYGCDTCQQACPWNGDLMDAGANSFWQEANPELLAILEMDKKEFHKRFAHTAAGWRGRNVLRRNALLALARPECKADFERIVPVLQDPSAMVRSYAAWTLVRMEPAKGRALILEGMQSEKEASVRQEWTAVLDWKSSEKMTDC